MPEEKEIGECINCMAKEKLYIIDKSDEIIIYLCSVCLRSVRRKNKKRYMHAKKVFGVKKNRSDTK